MKIRYEIISSNMDPKNPSKMYLLKNIDGVLHA